MIDLKPKLHHVVEITPEPTETIVDGLVILTDVFGIERERRETIYKGKSVYPLPDDVACSTLKKVFIDKSI